MVFRILAPFVCLCALTLAVPNVAPAAEATKSDAKKTETTKKKDAAPKATSTKKAPAASKNKPAAEGIDTAKDKLATFASEHVKRANTTLRPNRVHPDVQKKGDMYVATFQEVDVASLKTEIYESNTPGCMYVGHVVYTERQYEGSADNRKEALNADFKQVKTRRIRELTRYTGGKWVY